LKRQNITARHIISAARVVRIGLRKSLRSISVVRKRIGLRDE